jgi:hypothetical protein
MNVRTQEAQYIERWPNTTSVWAGWRRFDIPVDRYGGVQDTPCTVAPAVHLGLPPVTRLTSSAMLIEQNIKIRSGPAL